MRVQINFTDLMAEVPNALEQSTKSKVYKLSPLATHLKSFRYRAVYGNKLPVWRGPK